MLLDFTATFCITESAIKAPPIRINLNASLGTTVLSNSIRCLILLKVNHINSDPPTFFYTITSSKEGRSTVI